MAKALFEATRSPEVGITYAMEFAQTGNFDEAVKLQQETIIAFERAKLGIFQTLASKRRRGASGVPLSRADLYR